MQVTRGLIQDFPDNPYFHELEGQILFENGRVDAAVAPYRKAHELAPRSGQIEIGLTRVLLALNTPEADAQALEHMKSAIRTEGQWAFAWRQLAIAQGRVGDLGQAHLSLAEEALRSRDYRNAEQQARRAQASLPQGSAAALRALDLEELAKREISRRN